MKTSNVDLFLNNSRDSVIIKAEVLFNLSAQIKITGAAVQGSVSVFVSNDVKDSSQAIQNWSELTALKQTFDTTLGPVTLIFPKTDLCYQYVQFKVAVTSGSPDSIEGRAKTFGI